MVLMVSTQPASASGYGHDNDDSSDDERPIRRPRRHHYAPAEESDSERDENRGHTSNVAKELIKKNHYIDKDGLYHPIKKILGSYLHKDPKTGKVIKMVRIRWWDSDVLAEDVDAPNLLFNGYVNPNRVVVNHLHPSPKIVKSSNPKMSCRFCQQQLSTRARCVGHEPNTCRAPGAPNHVCGASCGQDCPGASAYKEPEDRRVRNKGRPKKN
ncbi:uncharacterized protein LOC141852601 [Brevipalpus obovatus]|uniref:uncharacterized protein LOC141852601 n=1 Tax=Brevipalpus obovatus TaxID=246614 RepID=UPI003D9E4DA5